jgi:lipid II:glycine glycyltransferase (peptidoglycan interpeptide bridge formation enzyme)
MQPTFTRLFLGELWRGLYPLGKIRALSAWRDGGRIAVLVLPLDSHTMYYWGGASYARFRSLPAHNLLHWHAIELARRLGLRCYDFISTRGGAGRFKKTFGPTLVTAAIHWERTHSRLMAALKNRYEYYLRARRRLQR